MLRRGSSAAFVAMVLLGAPLQVRADEADDWFAKGKELSAAGKIREAVDAYGKAFAVRKASDIACNLGGNELLLERWASGAQHLAFCLRTFPAKASPEVRKTAEAKLDEAKKHVGSIRVKVNVEVARVVVDGKDAGVSPLADPVFVEPGLHTIAAKLERHVGKPVDVVVAAGQEKTIELRLEGEVGDAGGKSVVPGVVLLAVGAAVGIVGGSLYGVGLSNQDAAKKEAASLDCTVPSACDPLNSRIAEANSFVLAGGTLGLVGATLALAGGIYLAVPARKKNTTLRVVPRFGGLGLTGSF